MHDSAMKSLSVNRNTYAYSVASPAHEATANGMLPDGETISSAFPTASPNASPKYSAAKPRENDRAPSMPVSFAVKMNSDTSTAVSPR